MKPYLPFNTAKEPFINRAKIKKTVLALLGTTVIYCALQLASTTLYDEGFSNTYQDKVEANNSSATAANFLDAMRTAYPDSYTIDKNGVASVTIRKNTTYHFYSAASYQEFLTSNALIKNLVLQALNKQGIEYQISIMPATKMATKETWLISWGGLLYLPKL